ncbi:Degradation activator [Serratia quinivorans]|uniref:LacI family DNA-binding transcriptional regulator n=1 Tax=Serratia quinivorans TaxID=137545 RepID=UPI000D9A7243|nr:LacI family DNA-binding transcriptional regulator [Serratia quinivorans]SPZ66493.1 Degradation activator [Serratia quinivorans]VEI70994.1 Degradation activator [Serratia quinivorans]
MPIKKVTSHDVARVAGVSRTVVSRAFSNQGRVSQKNRELVMRVASQLGYAPDAIAQSLHTGKTGFVAVVVNHFHDLSDLEFFDRLVEQLQNSNRQAVMIRLEGIEDPAGYLKQTISYHVDSAVVFADNISARAAKDLFRVATPIMLNGLAGDALCDALNADEAPSLQQLAALMAQKGQQRVAVLGGRSSAKGEQLRQQTFLAQAALQQLQIVAQLSGDYSYLSGFKLAPQLLAARPAPQAIFCTADSMAMGVMDYIRLHTPLRIPQDVAVYGFDDIPMAAWPSYQLTSVRRDISAMIAAIVQLIELRSSSPQAAPQQVTIPTELVVRASC